MSVSSEPLRADGAAEAPEPSAHKGGFRRELLESILFTAYGIFNNGVICVVYGAAQDIVNCFGFGDQTALPTLVSIVSAIVAPFLLLTWPMKHTGYRVRTIIACLCGCTGFVLLWTSASLMKPSEGLTSAGGMAVAMVGVFFLGLQQSFGENCACARFRRFSNKALSCWGAGTGLAGIFPPMLYGAISHLPLSRRFLVIPPLLAIYFGICLLLYEAGRGRGSPELQVEDAVCDRARVEPSVHAPSATPVVALETEGESRMIADGGQQPLNYFAWYVTAVFSGVYGIGFFIYPTLVDRATLCKPTSPLGNQAFNNSWIAYNVGVTIGRGGIAFFEFPCIWLILVLQATNLAGWAVEVATHFLPSMGNTGYIIQYAWMVWVGLMAGTSYANCISKFNRSPRIPAQKRDQLINLAFGFSMMIVMASTALGALLDNTVMTEKIVTSNCPISHTIIANVTALLSE